MGSGVIVGFAMGNVPGCSRPPSTRRSPLFSSSLAVVPLLLLIFGVGDTSTTMLVAIAVFLLVWITTMRAVMSVPDGWPEAARSFGASRRQLIGHVLLPASLPQILTGCAWPSGMAVLTTVGIEFVQGSDGLGALIWPSWRLFLPRRMYVGIVVVPFLGVTANLAVRLAARLLTPWDQFNNGARTT